MKSQVKSAASARAWRRGPAGGSRLPARPRPRRAPPSPRAARTCRRPGPRRGPPPRRPPLEVGADPSRVDVVEEGARHDQPWLTASAPGASIQARLPIRPARPWSRRWEKKSSGSQEVQRPADSTGTAGAGEQAAGDLGKVEHAAVGDPLAEVGEGACDLGADLVAARPDPGADRGTGRSTLAAPRATIPRREPAPSAVEHRHAAGPGERHRQAVGGEDEWRQARLADDVPVDLFQGRSRFGERAWAPGETRE